MTVAEAREELSLFPDDAVLYGPCDDGPAKLRRFVNMDAGTAGADVADDGSVTYTGPAILCEFGDEQVPPE